MRTAWAAALLGAWLLAGMATQAHAQPAGPGRQDGPALSLQGSLGSKALLVLDGEPLTLAVGQSARGVTLVALDDGRATQFLVDTGATNVALSQAEAERLGLRFREGRRVMTQTANGPAPGYLFTLTTMRVREVQVHNVEAIAVPGAMNHVLLGNSFLSRFQLRRDNDILTLEQRY